LRSGAPTYAVTAREAGGLAPTLPPGFPQDLITVAQIQKHRSPTQLRGLPGFWLWFQSPISNSPSRNAVVLDTQERLGIENNEWGLLIAETSF
jgi:hypothetical protein